MRRARLTGSRGATIAWLLTSLVGASCHRAFSCDEDPQCHLGDTPGVCEPDGWCSFPADDCPSGRRYGEHASSELAGACVPATGDTGVVTIAETGVGDGEPTTSTGEASTIAETSSTGDLDACNGLTPSGAVVVRADDTIVAGLSITVDGTDGITVENVSGVTIRDCEIHHRNGRGIAFRNADGLTLENVVIVHDGAPAAGPHADGDQANIDGADSAGLRIDHVRVSRGSSGIVLAATATAQLSFIEGHDIRGPGAGAFVRLFDSDGAVLEDFSCENPLDTGRPGDLIAVEKSSDVIVRRGLLDGHNSEFGYGVHVIHIPGQDSGALVEDVDAIRMTNGGFSCFDYGNDITFRRTRARENICEIVSVPIDGCLDPVEGGGCVPGSGGVTWSASGNSVGIVIEASSYWDLCAALVWPDDVVEHTPEDLLEDDFTPRAPIRIAPCWE